MDLNSLYANHLELQQLRMHDLFNRYQLDGLIIHSGKSLSCFMDDSYYPFKVNPYFKSWVPITQTANCWLWIDGVNCPRLWFYLSNSYWDDRNSLPEGEWVKYIKISYFQSLDSIYRELPINKRVVFIGDALNQANKVGILPEKINPPQVLNYLNYYRAYKTQYECECLRRAQKIAIKGHQAAYSAFNKGFGELRIHQTYLQETEQCDNELPYDNVVALNHHSAVLHHNQLQRIPPAVKLSFLLDAGAQYRGYASDITRTYASDKQSIFFDLLSDLEVQQQDIISKICSGVTYTTFHIEMHEKLAALLLSHGILRDISIEALVDKSLTAPFFPHGLGHFLGLQTHDVGGLYQDDLGNLNLPPSQYPHLRCTRILEPGMVLTVEPGLYFIESLLAPFREGLLSRYFNWTLIDNLIPYGGIRIEDNIILGSKGVENMTRSLGL